MPQRGRKRQLFDLVEAQRLRAQGISYEKIAAELGSSFGTVYRALNAPPQEPSNGNLPAIRPAQPSAPQRISALPVHPSASTLDDHEARLATLEAFMAVWQASQRITVHPSASVHPIASQRTEPPTWVSRGMHISTDVLASIEAYAVRYRLERREVVDRILHTFFAEVGQEGRADA